MIIENNEEKMILQEGGRRLALILQKVGERVRPGVEASSLNSYAEKLIEDMGDRAAFRGYTPDGATRPYPASLCVSINDEVVHGIPNEDKKVIQEGDLVTIDMGLIHENLFTDHAVTIPVGSVDKKGLELLSATKLALEKAIEIVKPGLAVGEIGFLIEEIAHEYGFRPADGLGGHGLGRSVHEEPFVPNFGPKDRGPELEEGQVIAIEPIFNEGKASIRLDDDGYTYITSDGKRSAQFEHTILIERDGAVILTQQ